MAYLTQVDTQTSSDVNLATALLVSTFTNTTRIRKVFVNVFADQIAGGGAYVCTVKVQRAGAGTAYTAKSESRTLGAETEVGFVFGPITINATDVVTVYLLGQAGDTTTPDVIVDMNEELPADPVTLADGAHGGVATTITFKKLTGANADAGASVIDLTATGSGNSHGIVVNSTNGKALALGSTNNDAVTMDSSAAKGLNINGSTADIDANITGTLSQLSAAATESYAADGAAATPIQLWYMIWAMLTEGNASGTTITVKKLDGATTAMTFTIDDADAPTTITRAT